MEKGPAGPFVKVNKSYGCGAPIAIIMNPAGNNNYS